MLAMRDAMVNGVRAMLAPGAKYDASVAASVDTLYRAMDRAEEIEERQAVSAERRAALVAFGKMIKSGGASRLDSAERRYFPTADEARIVNIAEGTPGAGGFMVPTLLLPKLVQKLAFYSAIIAAGATVIETPTGAPLNIPTVDETASGAGIVTESSAASASDVTTFSNVTLNSAKFSSGVIPVSFEMLQDSALNVAEMMLDLLSRRLARGLNAFLTGGTGANQPRGVLTGATLGTQLQVGSTAGVTFRGLRELYQSVDVAYRSLPSCGWMMSDSTLLVVQELADAVGRPLWLSDSLAPPAGSPRHGSLFGKPISINPAMPNLGAGATPILFGAFETYVVRVVSGAAFLRLDDSNYTRNGQAAFVAFGRYDGRGVSPNSAGLKYLQNALT